MVITKKRTRILKQTHKGGWSFTKKTPKIYEKVKTSWFTPLSRKGSTNSLSSTGSSSSLGSLFSRRSSRASVAPPLPLRGQRGSIISTSSASATASAPTFSNSVIKEIERNRHKMSKKSNQMVKEFSKKIKIMEQKGLIRKKTEPTYVDFGSVISPEKTKRSFSNRVKNALPSFPKKKSTRPNPSLSPSTNLGLNSQFVQAHQVRPDTVVVLEPGKLMQRMNTVA